MIRVGHGYDVHQLVSDRDLILGGVTIPHHLGLLGHSDADVVVHAICDAILGALAKGDIGKHFPDTDAEYKGKDSRFFVREVAKLMIAENYQISNLDVTIAAQAPKLAPYLAEMISNCAEDLSCSESQINIKATTTEKLGFVGKQQGIEAHAVTILVKQN